MKTLTKTLVVGTIPALIAAQALAAPADSPASQPATHPATQSSGPMLVESNEPLVIPDGTSIENPGPGAVRNFGKFGENGNLMPTTGVRG